MTSLPTWAVWILSFGTPVLVFVGVLVAQVISKQNEVTERERLTEEILGPIITSTTQPSSLTTAEGTAVERTEPISDDQTSRPHYRNRSGKRVAVRDEVYDQLLINDYALGLTQARRAFNVSMFFSIFGGMVLILGVALAVFRVATGGQVAGAAITSMAGVLTSGLSQLFRGQSTKALKHLEDQASELRRDVRVQTNVNEAQNILEQVQDVELRSRLQAALILQFTGATLPDSKPSQVRPSTLDGSAHNPSPIEPSVD